MMAVVNYIKEIGGSYLGDLPSKQVGTESCASFR